MSIALTQRVVFVGAGPEGLKDAKLVHSMLLENMQHELDEPFDEAIKAAVRESLGPDPFVSVEILPVSNGAGIQITSDDCRTANQIASCAFGAVRMLSHLAATRRTND